MEIKCSIIPHGLILRDCRWWIAREVEYCTVLVGDASEKKRFALLYCFILCRAQVSSPVIQ